MTRGVSLALVLLALQVLAHPAMAESWSKRLTKNKTTDAMVSFVIQANRIQDADRGEYIQFVVTVKGTDLPELPQRSGQLRVCSGKEFIVSCNISPTVQQAQRTYTFQVAAGYTAQSTFSYVQEGELGHISYWFYLQEFVETQ